MLIVPQYKIEMSKILLQALLEQPDYSSLVDLAPYLIAKYAVLLPEFAR